MLTVQPHLATDKSYLQHMIKYAVNCGVIDQWILGRVRGFPPKGELGDMSSEPNEIRSITEREYRTVESVSSQCYFLLELFLVLSMNSSGRKILYPL